MATPPPVTDETKEPPFSAEEIAYWFFRLNGCLFLENFLVHHEKWQKGNGTEIDLLCARFPHRQELKLAEAPMPDHPAFTDDKIEIIFTEVKSNQPCSINDSWLNSEGGNMERMLYLVGAIASDEVSKAAYDLYTTRTYENKTHRIRLFAIGSEKDDNLKGVTQLTWSDVLLFIHDRFSRYRRNKTEHKKWDEVGQRLFDLANKHHKKPEEFVKSITIEEIIKP
jgi:hypothetical protein